MLRDRRDLIEELAGLNVRPTGIGLDDDEGRVIDGGGPVVRPSIIRGGNRRPNRPTTGISVPVGPRRLERAAPAADEPQRPSILQPGRPFLTDMAHGINNRVDAEGQGLNALAAGFSGAILGGADRRANAAAGEAAAEQTAYDRSRDALEDERNAASDARAARGDEMDVLHTGAQIERIYAEMEEEVAGGRIEVGDVDAIENDLAQIRGDMLGAIPDNAFPEEIEERTAEIEEFIHEERARRYSQAMHVAETGRFDMGGDAKDAPAAGASPPPSDDAAATVTMLPPPEGVTGDGRSPTTPLTNESGDDAAYDAYLRTLPRGAHFIGNDGVHYQVKRRKALPG